MEKGIIVLGKSKNAKVKPLDIGKTKVSGFLGEKIKINRENSIPSLYKSFLKCGTVDNFLIAGGEKKDEIERRLATDSDLYKWMEAVSFDLQNYYDEEKDKLLDFLILKIGKAQEKSGYIDTFYTDSYRKERFKNLSFSHELYCGGHMIQSAISHFRATGKESFLNIAMKWADFICRKFGKGKIEENDGHPEVEMALVELYRTTREKKYLQLANFFMRKPYKHLGNFSFPQFKEVLGHAVRMMYLCCGATDYYVETGDEQYRKTLFNLWEDMSGRKTYITGGIGSRHAGETFGDIFELPNNMAYAESCAAIASMMWNFRMFCATRKSKYMDLFETTLYNGFLSNVSLDGWKYFYKNPLASRGEYERSPWYRTTCCPPNIQRMLASLPGYFYCVNEEGIWINLYNESEASIPLSSGQKIIVKQETEYPWSGKIKLYINSEKPEEFSIFLRIPSWCKNAEISYGGKKYVQNTGYVKIRKKWFRDKININFEMKPMFYSSHPEVIENRNCVCIKRGPVVYCLESVDNPGINFFQSKVLMKKLKYTFEPSLLGGVGTITGSILSPEKKNLPLYAPLGTYSQLKYAKKDFKAIPYFCWANRGKSRMAVWLPGTF